MIQLLATGRIAAALLAVTTLTALTRAQCALVADLAPGTTNNTNANGLIAAFGQELY